MSKNPKRECQRGAEPACKGRGSHELLIDGYGTDIRMCGPHAVEAVTEYLSQGGTSVSTIKR